MGNDRMAGSVGWRYRSAFKLLTALNHKTPKGEAEGWFTAILYLAPHVMAGGPTVCPHSTQACRTMCLAGAGMSGLATQTAAKIRRTRLYHEDRREFFDRLSADLIRLCEIARKERLKPAVRLNGTSDILWERELSMKLYPALRFYDYTKVPLAHRAPPANYHLTYSIGGPEDLARAWSYLARGQSCAVVVPEKAKAGLLTSIPKALGVAAIDGDEHDLRFLDPAPCIVLLKPKGRITTELIRKDFLSEMAAAERTAAA